MQQFEGVLCRELKGDAALPVLVGSAVGNRSLFRARLRLSLASPLLFLPHLSRIISAKSKVSQNSWAHLVTCTVKKNQVLFLDPSQVTIQMFLQSIVKVFHIGRKQCKFYLFGLSVIIFAHQINSLRCQMAKDRFKGSADSTIGNEMLRWQGKAVILFSAELFKISPCNFLKKLLLQTTTFSSAFVYIRNYFKTPST